MKKQQLDLEAYDSEEFRFTKTSDSHNSLAVCRKFVRDIFRSRDEMLPDHGQNAITVIFSRRPFKGATKVFVNIRLKSGYEKVRFGPNREYSHSGYIYENARTIILKHFPQDGIFPLYVNAIKKAKQ